MLLASLAYGVVSGDRLVELPDLQPFLALQLSLSAWEENFVYPPWPSSCSMYLHDAQLLHVTSRHLILHT